MKRFHRFNVISETFVALHEAQAVSSFGFSFYFFFNSLCAPIFITSYNWAFIVLAVALSIKNVSILTFSHMCSFVYSFIISSTVCVVIFCLALLVVRRPNVEMKILEKFCKYLRNWISKWKKKRRANRREKEKINRNVTVVCVQHIHVQHI